RPREFDMDEALEAAMQVFWEKGYQGSSLNDLLDAMNIARGSLYKAFDDKRAIYLATLKRYEQNIVDDALCTLKSPDGGDVKDRVRQLLMRTVEAVEHDGDRRGCLLCNAAVDLLPSDSETRNIVFTMVKKVEGALVDVILEYGRKKGWPDDKSHSFALNINAVYIGLRMLVRAGYASEDLHAIIEHNLKGFE
ncbi:MAG: TetR/AcrR family transcriptional regulator, partial [Sphingomonadales bacterium]